MHKLKKSLEIRVPVERVYEFVTTPTNLPELLAQHGGSVERADPPRRVA
jgi:hypothetical protein